MARDLSSPSAPDGRTPRRDWIIVTLLAVSLIQNLVLGVGILRLSGGKIAPPSSESLPTGPKVGAVVPPLDVQRFKGARELVGFSADRKPTLMYVFSPSCSWCAKNLSNVKTILRAATTSHHVLALSLDPNVDDYVQTAALNVPIYIKPSEKMFGPYGLGPTPLTFVVGPDGKVLKSWVGAYSGETQKDVEAYFGVKLPGFVRQSAATVSNE